MGDEQIYVKDLRVLKGIDLSQVLIIDNCVLCFIFHIDNGIPILPFYENKNNIELRFLVEYLGSLSGANDIRAENKKLIPLEQLLQKVCNEDLKYVTTNEDMFNNSKNYIL